MKVRVLERKDEPAGFVRKDLDMPGVRMARGEARDAKSLEAAVDGPDAIFSAFGLSRS